MVRWENSPLTIPPDPHVADEGRHLFNLGHGLFCFDKSEDCR